MTRNSPPPDAPTDDSALPTELSDPTELADSPTVDYREHTAVHDDGNYCEADVAGRTVVGLTDEDGAVLLHVNRERSAALLPNGKVQSDEDWLAAGRRAAEELTGLAVRIDGPRLVRRVEHVVDGADEPQATTHHLVVEASPEAGRPNRPQPTVPAEQADEWEAGWFDSVPVEPNGGLHVDDVRLFVD
ncbi:NUDIX domain-containing protein [Halostella litorea]|uniref:NUDIX domain-containing protein n=1 Tax=Halostella litorea TaxID=2528831 RepID=UPI001092A97A|nr:NUDIX domain-containing protein [Halostella litorea]